MHSALIPQLQGEEHWPLIQALSVGHSRSDLQPVTLTHSMNAFPIVFAGHEHFGS